MKVLVTGGAGFIGSHLCERLIQEGHEVISIDNYFNGSFENHIQGVEYCNAGTYDIFNMDINYFSKTEYPDLIFHLGEYSRVEQSFDDRDLIFEYNIKGTWNLLQWAGKHKIKVIYAGSSTKFVDDPDYIQSPYAWSKASNTELVKKWAQWYNTEYAITYFYNVYGERESAGKYGTLIEKYRQTMLNYPYIDPLMNVTSPGNQLRNFTHVHDIVDALILIGKKGHGDEYGIGHPDAYSILNVVEMFGGIPNLTGNKLGNRMSSPVITNKTQELGWEPKRNLPDYIADLKKNHWNHI